MLADYSEVFKRTKHELKIIEPQFHGLGKFLINHGEKNNLILDIGYTSTRILFYVNGFLKEERHIETDQANDLETFLAPIAEGVLESFQSPLSLARGFENETIFLSGGGSLIPGVIGYLSEKINREIARLSIFGRDSEMFKFQKEIPEEDLCLLMPCLGGMLGWENKKE
ncbi:hypothetical protein [Acetobacterium sp.]|uniref:hypothetical protein n=1 Tax=Acetobacterium sp. TaxID=1872094 RepID=UPI002F413A2C